MFRSAIAILAGYATMAAFVAGTTAALAKLWPSSLDNEDQPTLTYTTVNLAYSGLLAAAGGYVTSALARRSPMGHTLALAALILILGPSTRSSPAAENNRDGIWLCCPYSPPAV